MNRIDRLVALLTSLQSKKFVSAQWISDKYDISIRTVYRDIKALGEIGVPLYFEPNKGYSIVQGYFLPPVSFSSEEANALILLASLSEKFGDKTIQQNANAALDKIKAVLRGNEKEKADFFHEQIRIYNPPDSQPPNDYLTTIQHAMVQKLGLKISYTNNLGKSSTRTVEPIGLTFYSMQWHMIAWCWLRNEYRDFKVLRISKLNLTEKPFEKEKHLSLDSYIKTLE